MLKILKQSLYPVYFLIGAVAVLAFGIAFRATRAPRPLSESVLALQPTKQARRLNELPQYLTDAAASAATGILYLASAPHSAVMWDQKHAVTAADLTRPRWARALSGAGAEVDLEPVRIPSETPLDYWTVPPGAVLPPAPHDPTPAGSPVASGEWVVAVGRATKDHVVFAEGIYQGTSPAHCGPFEYVQVNSSALLSNSLSGGGLFSTKGNLLGVILACAGEPIVVSVETVEKALRRPVFITDHLQTDYGITVVDAPPETGKSSRVLVSTVWKNRPADLAGLQAGDRILSADGKRVELLSDLDLLENGGGDAAHTLTLSRKGRKLHAKVTVRSPQGRISDPLIIEGLSLIPNRAGARLLVGGIAAESVWAKSGLQAGDALVAIRNAPVRNVRQAAQALSDRRRPLSVTIERGMAKAEVYLPNE